MTESDWNRPEALIQNIEEEEEEEEVVVLVLKFSLFKKYIP
jgi:hypothetical protein